MFNKTYFLAVVFFVIMAIAFLLVTILLKLKDNNPKLIRKKLKLGAAMLTLTAIINCCGQKNTEQISCYAAGVIEDSDEYTDSNISINKNDSLYKKFLRSAVKDLKITTKVEEPVISCYDVSYDPPAVEIDSIIELPDKHINLCYMPLDNFNDTL